MTSFQIEKSNRLHVTVKKRDDFGSPGLSRAEFLIEFVIGKTRDYLSIHKLWYHYK